MRLKAVGGVGSGKETTGRALDWCTSSEAARAIQKIQHYGPCAHHSISLPNQTFRCSVHLNKGPCRALCQSISRSVTPISRLSTRVNREGSKRGANNDLNLNLIASQNDFRLSEHGVVSSICDVNSCLFAYFMVCSIAGFSHKITANRISNKRRFLTSIVPKSHNTPCQETCPP